MFSDTENLRLYSRDSGYLRYGIWQNLVNQCEFSSPEDVERLAEFGIKFILDAHRDSDEGDAPTGQYL